MKQNRKKQLLWQIPFLLLLLVGTVIIVSRQQSKPYQHNSGLIFGTVYNITYQSYDDLNSEILAELNKVDQSLSTFKPNSIISQVNQNKPVETDEMFNEVFNLAEEISKETGGAFDITVAPMVNMWGFGFKHNTTPTPQAIDSVRRIVGFEKVKLQGNKVVKLNKNTMLDCSAIAKGYGSDVVARFLRAKGIENFMVEIGGEIVTQGINEQRLPWRIGVTKPTDDSLSTNGELQTVINVTNMAMATSGNYRNFYYKNGKKYAHTIDPKTGYPVQHNILSATVLAKECAVADAYATAFMVTGLKGATQILHKHPELMAYFIYADEKGRNRVWYSPSLKDKLPQTENE